MDDQLTVVRADGTTKVLRSQELEAGVHGQVVLVSDAPESVPDLTGATVGLIAVSAGAATALDPPDVGARICWVRAWEDAYDPANPHRLFYRRDGVAPAANGSNCESYLVHGEGRVVKLAVLGNFKMIAETGSTFHISNEFSNT